MFLTSSKTSEFMQLILWEKGNLPEKCCRLVNSGLFEKLLEIILT